MISGSRERRMRHAMGWVAALGLAACWPMAALAASPAVLIRNASLVRSGGAPTQPGVDLLVESGVIRKIGENLIHPDAMVIDATGKTVLPGLIDCHTHLNSVPGALSRGDGPQALARARKTQLRAYVAAGVTTVLDTAAPPSVLTTMRTYVERSNLGPRIEGLAPLLTPKDGYYFGDADLIALYFPGMWSPIGEDLSRVDAHLDAAAPLGPIGVKVTIEDGIGPLPVLPLFDDVALAHIKASAAAHDTPIFVHAVEANEYARALKLEPYAFVHGGFMQSTPDAAILRGVKKSKAVVITTLAISDMMRLTTQPARMDSPWLQMLVPEEQRATAASPEHTSEMLVEIFETNLPSWVPRLLIRFFASLYSDSQPSEQLQSSMSAVKAMYDAGIPLVMGSDMGNWPVLTSLFHGVGSIREMELLEAAGIPRREVLTAATTRAAALLGRSEQIGAVEVGMKADLIIANRNPLDAGMSALRDLAYVMKNGEIRTPAEWMSQPAQMTLARDRESRARTRSGTEPGADWVGASAQ